MKMRQVIAIGGGGFGRTQESNLIEQYILDQTSKKNPKTWKFKSTHNKLQKSLVCRASRKNEEHMVCSCMVCTFRSHISLKFHFLLQCTVGLFFRILQNQPITEKEIQNR